MSLVTLKSKGNTGIASFSLKEVINQGLLGSQNEYISWKSMPRFFSLWAWRVWVWKIKGENP